ncbi:hypothetical protein [Fictibacillus sp. FJAT-27399]|nr:hypothetical protein [Fictibacillus sp. FJAT-27399]
MFICVSQASLTGWLRNDMPYTPLFLAKQFYLLLPGYRDKEL